MGKIIEFYHPKAKPPAHVPVEEPEPDKMPAADIISKLAEGAKNIDDILVLMRDTDGQLGFVTNLADLAASNLFIDRVKHRILAKDREQNEAGPGPKGAA
jgi:hypothetical protein